MLQIIHTNDFHDRLTDEKAERLTLMRRQLGASGLMLDAGDAGGSGNLTFRPSGEAILERMSAIGYDAMTVGNRDFHLTRTGFRCKLSRATFPILCANVYAAPMPSEEERRAFALRAADGPWSGRTATEQKDLTRQEPLQNDTTPTRRYVVFERKGRRIVVLGLTVPMITEQMLSRKVSAYVFEAPLHCAQRLVPLLRERYAPDLFVALTHIGYARDQELAATVPGIDLIIGGHSHTVLEEGTRVENTLIVQAGSRGSHVGRVEIELQEGATPLTMQAKLEPL